MRIAMLSLGTLALLAPLVQAGSKSAPRPNIVYIMADDLGWNDVGFHGSTIKTPHLDKLAKKGVQLNQFYVMPVCSPTRASLLTGRYPIRYGLQTGVVRPWADYGLPLNERTLAQALHAAGYFTAIVGKWHLGTITPDYFPTKRGFDHHYGHYLGAIDYFKHDRMGGLDWHRNAKPLVEEGYTTELMGQEAVKLIKNHDFKKKPMFLYVAFNAPHSPLQAPEKYLDQYREVKNKKRQAYSAMVTCLDDAVGRIVAELEARGVLDNTLIIFHSDNGGPVNLGASNTPLRAGKGTLYAGGVRVSAFVIWAGHLKAGTVNNEPLHVVDWYPTLIKLGGGSLEKSLPLDGKDIWPTLAEGKPSPHKEILFNVEAKRGALLKEGWKIVVTATNLPVKLDPLPAKGIELFHLDQDPEEKKDLAAQNPAKVRELLMRLNSYAKEAVPAKGGQGAEPANFKAPKVWGEPLPKQTMNQGYSELKKGTLIYANQH